AGDRSVGHRDVGPGADEDAAADGGARGRAVGDVAVDRRVAVQGHDPGGIAENVENRNAAAIALGGGVVLDDAVGQRQAAGPGRPGVEVERSAEGVVGIGGGDVAAVLDGEIAE